MSDVNLTKALQGALILLDKGWTKNAFARDRAKRPVGAYATEAVCFCAIGAINRVFARGDDVGRAIRLLYSCIPPSRHGYLSVSSFNDHPDTTFNMVRQMYETAIEKSKEATDA